jgi:hypothetical protein
MTALAATEPFLLRAFSGAAASASRTCGTGLHPWRLIGGATFTDPNLIQQPPSNHGKKKPAVTKRRCRQILHHI